MGICLGGVIATAIALLLEEIGIHNVTIISWDSVITNKDLIEIRNKNSLLTVKQALNQAYSGASATLIARINESIESSIKLLNAIFLKQLTYTNIVLFKTLLVEDKIKILQPEYEYICSLIYNNFDMIQPNLTKINKIELADAKHGGFLSQVELVAKNIIRIKNN